MFFLLIGLLSLLYLFVNSVLYLARLYIERLGYLLLFSFKAFSSFLQSFLAVLFNKLFLLFQVFFALFDFLLIFLISFLFYGFLWIDFSLLCLIVCI